MFSKDDVSLNTRLEFYQTVQILFNNVLMKNYNFLEILLQVKIILKTIDFSLRLIFTFCYAPIKREKNRKRITKEKWNEIFLYAS